MKSFWYMSHISKNSFHMTGDLIYHSTLEQEHIPSDKKLFSANQSNTAIYSYI